MRTDWTTGIAIFVIVSAVLQPILLRQRGIPHRELWIPEPGNWRWGQRIAMIVAGFAIAGHLASLMNGFGGHVTLVGIPLIAWAAVVWEIYLWLRCAHLIRSKRTL